MKKLLLIAALGIAFVGCYNDKSDKLYPLPAANACDTTTITYSHDVKSILDANCNTSGCHNSSGNASTGNLDFTVFTTLKANATADLIIADINGAPVGKGHAAMPLGLPKMSQCEINKVTRWINLGALNN